MVATGIVVYFNSFSGMLVFDDENNIIKRIPVFESVTQLLRAFFIAGERHVVTFSMALSEWLTPARNCTRFSGAAPWGFHGINLAVHIAAALTLFGIVNQTLRLPRQRDQYGSSAPFLALAVALIFLVHPLQTESVTYVVQRAQAMMGLFALLSFYAAVCGIDSPRKPLWDVLAVVAFALSLDCKPHTVALPFALLLYHRAFVTEAMPESLRRNAGLFAGMAWVLVVNVGILCYRMKFAKPGEYGMDIGDEGALVDVPGGRVTGMAYALSQFQVIAWYLRLSVWPNPLCLDYAWPLAKSAAEIVPCAIGIGVLCATTIWACVRSPRWGFIGAWFFLMLAPSSTVIARPDLLVEHRMYLPLVAVSLLMVFAGFHALRQFAPHYSGVAGGLAVAAIVAGFGFLTVQRNADYSNSRVLWEDTVAQRPENPRAHYNLADIYDGLGRHKDALWQLSEALRIKPHWAQAHNNLAVDLDAEGKSAEALVHFQQAIEEKPDLAPAWSNRGNTLMRLGRNAEAKESFLKAIDLQPANAEAHSNLAMVLCALGKSDEALSHCETALQIKPDYVEAHYNRGALLAQSGKFADAKVEFETALKLKPDFEAARRALQRLNTQR